MKGTMWLAAGSVLAFLTASLGSAHATASVPIVDLKDQAFVTQSGKTPSLEQVGRGILVGAQKRGWNATEKEPGVITADILVRGKHKVIVRIEYTRSTYSIYYVHSENMNFEKRNDGTSVIHPNYNKWIENLVKNIRAELIGY